MRLQNGLPLWQLGLVLEKKLTFDFHLKEKIFHKVIGLLKWLSILSWEILLVVYKTFIRPHFGYTDELIRIYFIVKTKTIQHWSCLTFRGHLEEFYVRDLWRIRTQITKGGKVDLKGSLRNDVEVFHLISLTVLIHINSSQWCQTTSSKKLDKIIFFVINKF